MLGHILTDWAVELEPTCEADGINERHCTRDGCEYKETEVIPMLGHILTEWAVEVEPTCEADGISERHCTREGCGYKETEPIAALGHDMTEWAVVSDSTCTETGVRERHCNRDGCGYQETEVIALKDHSYGEVTVVQAPTCTVNGYYGRVCSVCGHIEYGERINPEGHNLVIYGTNYLIDKECTEEVVQPYMCTKCNEIFYRVEPAKDHTIVVIKNPEVTCEEDGYEIEYCIDCGKIIDERVIAHTGHNYIRWRVHTEATCTEPGWREHICTKCSHIIEEGEVIAPLGHLYGEWVTFEDGHRERTCYRCWEKETEAPQYEETTP